MNNKIIYRPYRSHGWFVPLAIAISIVSFMALGFSITDIGAGTFLFITIASSSTFLAKFLYDSSNIVILFEQESLQIIGNRYNNYRCFPWKSFSYVYYVKNYKGHLFLILSPQALSFKKAKKFANRSANSSKICIDNLVIIPIDDLQNMSQIKQLIDSLKIHVNIY